MNKMTWLVRREFWEHKGAMLWAPVVVAGAMLLAMGGALFYGLAKHGPDATRATLVINGYKVTGGAIAAAMSPEAQARIAGVAASSYMAASVPLFLMLAVISFFYCLGALYDERRDRSILFWKSLPTSDRITVLSKIATAIALAPLITIAVATVMSLALLALGLAALATNGVNLSGALLSEPELYLAPLRLLGLLPVYAVWALPTVGWLLMVSAWARSKVVLWAVGGPLMALVVLKWINFLLSSYSERGLDIDWFAHQLVGRALGGLIPGFWFGFDRIAPAGVQSQANHGVDAGSLFMQSWASLASPGVWVAALAGVGMVLAAIRLRRVRDEL